MLASVGVSVRQYLTDRIQLSGELAHNERITTGDVFSTRDNSLRLSLDYALSGDSTLYLAGEHRSGDSVSSGQASLAKKPCWPPMCSVTGRFAAGSSVAVI